ncbi:hypothetical protein B5S31_g5019 [[Candida] boidinii]|nr:hypothetical protein B5S31_g5019 [[Candida] boidinii]
MTNSATDEIQKDFNSLNIKDDLQNTDDDKTSEVIVGSDEIVKELMENENYIDITQDFFKITSKIEFGKIIKSSSITLLEGTHALEALNPKLDGFLLPSTKFDTLKSRPLDEVNWVMQKLTEKLCCWLDNNSLSVTVFSCAYVEELLINYEKAPQRYPSFRSSPKFNGDESIETYLKYYTSDEDDEEIFVHCVLKVFIMGLVQFVKFVISLGMAGVIYEDEDLNAQTMDLNLFYNIDVTSTWKDLDIILEWLEKKSTSYTDKVDSRSKKILNSIKITKNLLNLVYSLTKLQTILYKSINPFSIDENKDFIYSNLEYINNNLKLIKSIKSEKLNYFNKLPILKNCFSVSIQRRCNNMSPPKTLAKMKFDKTYENLIKMFKDYQFMLEVVNCKDTAQMQDFFQYFTNYREDDVNKEKTEDDGEEEEKEGGEDDEEDDDGIIGIHVVIRALFQLFFIRDDKSIMGNTNNFTLLSMVIDNVQDSTCFNSQLFQFLNVNNFYSYLTNNDSKNPSIEIEEKKGALQFEFSNLLSKIENPFYNTMTIISQNPSRQRQLFNRQLILLDSLQVETEKFETELETKYNIIDSFLDNNGNPSVPILPISSWVYLVKLETMIDIVVRGIELECYKDLRELFVAYWYLSYLIDHLLKLLARLQSINSFRQQQINNIPKRIKKLKSTDKKKLKLKNDYNNKLNYELPILKIIELKLNNKLKEIEILNKLISIQSSTLCLLSSLNFIKLPKLIKIPEIYLFNLQLKPFQSVGVPNLPSFEIFKEYESKFKDLLISLNNNKSFKPLKDLMNSTSVECTELIKNLIKEFENKAEIDNSNITTPILNTERLKWYKSLLKSNITSSLNFQSILKEIEKDKFELNKINDESYKVLIDKEGYNRYFPIFKLIKKKTE